MTVTGVAGVGTEFRRWNTSLTPGAWEKIAKITKITGPSPKVDTQDTSSLDTTGGSKTFIAGLIDEGEMKLSMNFERDNYDTFNSDLRSRALHNYQIVLPDVDNTSYEFEALVTSIDMTIDEKIITADVTLKISGAPALDSGSGPSPGS